MFNPDKPVTYDPTVRPFAVTHRMVLMIALPMTLAGITTPLLGLVDTGVIGQLGDAAMLGGLAMGALVFDFLFTLFGFLRTGTTGLVAQAMGRGDSQEEVAVFWRAMIIAITAGILMILSLPFILQATLAFMQPGDGAALALTEYVSIRMISAPMALINYVLLGLFLGRGKGVLGLILQILLNGINIILALLLGLVLGWEVAGVAWATVIGETTAAIVGLVYLSLSGAGFKVPMSGMILERAGMLKMFAINRDIMIRSLLLMTAFVFFTRISNELGTITLAANTILMNFFMVIGFFLDGITIAAEQIVGRAVGARYGPAFRRSIKLTSIWGMAMSVGMGGCLLLFGADLIKILTTSPEVQEMAAFYLPWLALTALTGLFAFQMDSVFIGATWSRDMRNMMFLSLIIFFAALFGARSSMGNHGLWLALNMFLLVRGISLAYILPKRYRREFAVR